MNAYRSPDNPNVIVIPASGKDAIERQKREWAIQEVRSEPTDLYKAYPDLVTRLDEVERIQSFLTQEAEALRKAIEENKARQAELEALLRQS